MQALFRGNAPVAQPPVPPPAQPMMPGQPRQPAAPGPVNQQPHNINLLDLGHMHNEPHQPLPNILYPIVLTPFDPAAQSNFRLISV